MQDKKIDIESLKRDNIYKVPDGYFDELPLKIQTRLNQERSAPRITSVSWTRMQWSLSLTAAVVIFIIGWLFYPQTELNSEQLLAQVSTEDMIAYLHEENVTLDEILASVDGDYLIDELSNTEFGIIDDNVSVEDLESIYYEIDFSTEIL